MWPWDWVRAAYKGVLGIPKAITDLIANMISSVVSWVQDAIDVLQVGINFVASELQSVYDVVIHFAESIGQQVMMWALKKFFEITAWTTGLFARLYDYAQSVLTWAEREVITLYSYINSIVGKIEQWVISNIWSPLWSFVNGVYKTLSDAINAVRMFIEHPEMLIQLIGGYLLQNLMSYVKRYSIALTRWFIRASLHMGGELFDVLESIISAII